ncbi:MAG: jacalin-like lectin, partial [Sphaerospermopsis kisseleviana]
AKRSTAENGETVDENWIFELSLDAMSDVIFWAIVPRSGDKKVYNYGYYPLNGDANDKTSNANHGTINGAVWEQEEVPITDNSLVKVGAVGGSISGRDFEFLPQNTAPKSRLKSVIINEAWAIGTLQVEYENMASTPVETYRSARIGLGGGKRQEVSIEAGDHLTKLTGTWGRSAPGYHKHDIITIQFETKKGIKSPIFGGGSGKAEVEPFVLEAPEGQEIIGFFGSHGGPQGLLLRLGIYCQPISSPENKQESSSAPSTESSVISENKQESSSAPSTESSVISENKQESSSAPSTESSVISENQQESSAPSTESSVISENQQESSAPSTE